MNPCISSIAAVDAAVKPDGVKALSGTIAPPTRSVDIKAEAAALKEDMTFGEIDVLKHPVLRAMALISTTHCEPWTAYWRRLIKSVDVPEAGEWGQQAQALLDQKPSAERVKRHFSSDGNLFLSFAEDLARAVDVGRPDKPTATVAKVEG